jgi:hypothetical protein
MTHRINDGRLLSVQAVHEDIKEKMDVRLNRWRGRTGTSLRVVES